MSPQANGAVISLVQNTSLADGSPMPNSPSSMVNQYRLEEDDDDEEEQQDADAKDIFITVDNPESHVTAIETFIMYRVVTKVGGTSYCSRSHDLIYQASQIQIRGVFVTSLLRPRGASSTPATTRYAGATRTSCGSEADWKKPTRRSSSTYVSHTPHHLLNTSAGRRGGFGCFGSFTTSHTYLTFLPDIFQRYFSYHPVFFLWFFNLFSCSMKLGSQRNTAEQHGL